MVSTIEFKLSHTLNAMREPDLNDRITDESVVELQALGMQFI
jgi:hypothetical protein